VKKLLCAVVIATVFGAVGSESDVDLYCYEEEEEEEDWSQIMFPDRSNETEEERFQRESDWWKSFCRYKEEDPFNHHDLTSVEIKLRNEVTGDTAAEGAMDIFLSSFYWKFVDYCVGHLSSMSEINQQRFKEMLILLAPGLGATRYKERAVNLVGRDQNDVRATDIQYLPFCLDMFFYAAVKNGQLGRYALAKMFTSAFYAPCLTWDSDGCADERFKMHNIWLTTFPDTICCDWNEIRYNARLIWPNWK
jgi:hypothetical protein